MKNVKPRKKNSGKMQYRDKIECKKWLYQFQLYATYSYATKHTLKHCVRLAARRLIGQHWDVHSPLEYCHPHPRRDSSAFSYVGTFDRTFWHPYSAGVCSVSIKQKIRYWRYSFNCVTEMPNGNGPIQQIGLGVYYGSMWCRCCTCTKKNVKRWL